MPCTDAKNSFTSLSTAVALPASATSEYSTYELHFETGLDAYFSTLANPNIGNGTPVYFNFRIIATAATASGSPTLTLDLVGDTTTAPTTVVQNICSAVADTTLIAGYGFSVALKAMPAIPVYLRLKVTANDAGFDAGTYMAWLSTEPLSDV